MVKVCQIPHGIPISRKDPITPVSLEHVKRPTWRLTSKQIVEQQLNQRPARSEDGNEDQSDHRDETGEHGVLVSESFGDETVDEESDDFTTVGGLRKWESGWGQGYARRRRRMLATHVTQSGLPSSGNLIRSIRT